MNVLVTDGDQRPALAITRSLGRRGVSVWVRAGSLASSSKYAVRHINYPSPCTDPSGFERFLLKFVARERVDVVMPVTDVTTQIVARNVEALGRHTATAVPSFEAFEAVTDKWRLLQRASACGIPIPTTHFVDGKGGLSAHLPHVTYPAVVKPTRSRIPTDAGWLTGSTQYVANEAELVRLYRDSEVLGCWPSLIQERVVGHGVGVFVLCDHGRVVATFSHRRLREKPPSGGVSVLCESVAFDPALQDHARRLLEPIGWHGVAMLEYKLDQQTRQAVLMEVNGRFWGSLQLAIDAGVDFPYLSYQLALGQAPDLPVAYDVGVKSRWLLGDLDHLLIRVLRGRRDLPATAPSTWGAFMNFVRAAAPAVRGEMLRRDDPGPAGHELWRYTKALSLSAAHRLQHPLTRFGFGPLFRAER
jgi:predicted ATP-grasp superfamily ATP-dependent carboligase